MTTNPEMDRLIAQGLEASRAGQAQAALALFAQASEATPGSGLPHFLIGAEHAAAGNINLAEAAFARAVLLSPDFALARYQLGLLQFTSQRAAVALLTWQPLFGLPPGDAMGCFVRGFEALARDDFAAALGHFRLGLACDDLNPAMASDIQRVVEAVERLPQAPAEGDTVTDTDASHILLSGYARGPH